MRTLEGEAERARALVARSLPRIKCPDVLEYATSYLVTGTGVWEVNEPISWTDLDNLVWDIVYILSHNPSVFETESYHNGVINQRPSELDRLEKLLSDEPQS